MTEQSNVTDQPVVESKTEDQVNGQEEITSDESQKSDDSGKTEQLIDLDGEKLSPEQIKEWKAGYMRQQDYTKKTQELAEEKRTLSRAEQKAQEEELDPDVRQAVDVLKKAGVVTKEDLALMKAQEEDTKQFKKLLKTHPELKAHEKAIAQIGRVDNRAWNDIAIEYGFLQSDKLSKAKTSKEVVGSKVIQPEQPKSIRDMSPDEYATWKKQNIGTGLIATT